MRSAFPFVLLLSFAYAVSSPSLLRRQANSAIASSSFRRRGYHSSAILDGWLYIDGGEFSYASGSSVIYQYSSSLLAIDLGSDWSNSSVDLHSNSKPAGVPDLVSGGLWVDPKNKVLYSGFAGRKSDFGDAADQDSGLWSFTPDNQGGGSWKNLNSSADVRFKTDPRPNNALVASGSDAGYLVGGLKANGTSYPFPLSGLLTYNFTTNRITHSLVSGPTNAGEIQQGGAHFVPNFGPQGILVTWGGNQRGKVKRGADSLVATDNVQIFDPASGTWYQQATSGSTPEARKEFCMTGAASSNSTYEIFMYAGWNGNLGGAAIPFDEVFVLSLPSFSWFKANYLAGNPRHALTCEHVGGGQIVTIGGVNTTTNGPDNLYKDVFNTADEFTQGLAVFDLNRMAWKDEYTANQSAYSPNTAIQQYYALNAREPTYSSNGLKNLMSIQSFTSAAATAPATSSRSGSSSQAGAIAGGVVAGVAVIGIAAGVFFFINRKRRQGRKGAVYGAESYHYSSAPQDMTGQDADGGTKHELGGSQLAAPVEMTKYAKYADEELDHATRPSEMLVEQQRHELA